MATLDGDAARSRCRGPDGGSLEGGPRRSPSWTQRGLVVTLALTAALLARGVDAWSINLQEGWDLDADWTAGVSGGASPPI